MRNAKGQYEKGHVPANKGEKISKNCEQCGNQFFVHPFRASSARFCSTGCKGKWFATKRIGSSHPNWMGDDIEMECQYCHKRYFVRPSRGTKSKYCSHLCHNRAMSQAGEGHHNFGRVREDLRQERNHQWRGGVTRSNDMQRRSPKYRIWRDKVFARDNYTCQHCGTTNTYVTAHHIKSFADFPELRFDIDNGITLCESCHEKTDTYKGAYYRKKHRKGA